MKSFIITSSGTDGGKTLITLALCHQLKSKKILAIKPVISGWNDKENDVHEILDSLALPYTKSNVEKISLYRFKAPLSPDIAAKKEKKKIDFKKLLSFCRQPKDLDYLFIEGIGGAMVPLTGEKTILDLFAELKMPIILVIGSYLGSLSHTLTTISAIEGRKLKIQQIIVTESAPSDEEGFTDDMINSLKNFVNYPIFKIPYIEKSKEKWKHVPPMLGILKE